jgi:uncharacterized membrane protein
MDQFPVDFKRNAVEPMVCMKAGWSLVKDQYWLFVGMVVVTMFLNGLVPFCILLGPMMCGIYLSLFLRHQHRRVEFDILFRGFDYFVPSLIATMLHLIPSIIVMSILFALVMLGPFLLIPLTQSRELDAAVLILLLVVAAILVIILFCVFVIFTVASAFVYPLIVDRKLSGLAAIKLSAKAGFANFWKLLGLALLNVLLTSVGVLCCYVGLFLVLPLTFGSTAIAYTQVFGLGQIQSAATPPPPPRFN